MAVDYPLGKPVTMREISSAVGISSDDQHQVASTLHVRIYMQSAPPSSRNVDNIHTWPNGSTTGIVWSPKLAKGAEVSRVVPPASNARAKALSKSSMNSSKVP